MVGFDDMLTGLTAVRQSNVLSREFRAPLGVMDDTD